MRSIIEYNNEIAVSNGGVITPSNEIVFSNEGHEVFSEKYCLGDYSELICTLDYNQLFNKDEFVLSTKLKKEELELCKLWLKYIGQSNEKRCVDFMTLVLGYDKFQTLMRRAIITTDPLPHIKYYNYYLMDWYIDEVLPMKFNNETGLFESYKKEISLIEYSKDSKMEQEIMDIKKNVKIKDRPHFFK